jgi:hypothetical protein
MGFAMNPAVAKDRTAAERQTRWRERRKLLPLTATMLA